MTRFCLSTVKLSFANSFAPRNPFSPLSSFSGEEGTLTRQKSQKLSLVEYHSFDHPFRLVFLVAQGVDTSDSQKLSVSLPAKHFPTVVVVVVTV